MNIKRFLEDISIKGFRKADKDHQEDHQEKKDQNHLSFRGVILMILNKQKKEYTHLYQLKITKNTRFRTVSHCTFRKTAGAINV
ncbi:MULTISPECIES: hypothetical protein [unclassified Flavobacterium]|uniref:hypothetical protein n=1 Tax=unclassified Flavobacterium TaxID=196869 RepID=UPI001AD2D7EC|nr:MULTISPECIES: hypothetical protein [unclassified Flavobacterium]MBN9284024.1 hypothetical protein [Flavobacterium sp.]